MALAYGLEVKKDIWQLIDYRGTWVRQIYRKKLNPEKTKLIMFSRTMKETTNKPALFLYGYNFRTFLMQNFQF